MWAKMSHRNNDIPRRVDLVMGRCRLYLIFVVLVFANLIRGPVTVLASCAVTPHLASAISDAPAVFVGTVTSVDHAGRVATVHVEDIWKGRVSADVQLVGTPDLSAGATSVDRYYSVGQKYLFIPYAGSDNSFEDNNCTLTQAYTAGLVTFRPAGAPGQPAATRGSGAAVPAPAPQTASWPLFIVGGGLIVVVIVMLAIAQRRRHSTTSAGQ
jgi:hypothetical protein